MKNFSNEGAPIDSPPELTRDFRFLDSNLKEVSSEIEQIKYVLEQAEKEEMSFEDIRNAVASIKGINPNIFNNESEDAKDLKYYPELEAIKNKRDAISELKKELEQTLEEQRRLQSLAN